MGCRGALHPCRGQGRAALAGFGAEPQYYASAKVVYYRLACFEKEVTAVEEKKDILKKSFGDRLFQGLLNGLIYITLRPKVIWQDKELKKAVNKKPCIFVCNHTHHFDGSFAGAILDRYKPYVLVTAKWYNKKKIGPLVRMNRTIPIDLNSTDTDWYMNCQRALKEGKSLVIFPEGAVAREGKMQPFKPGAGVFSAKLGVDIVPVAIYGPYKILFGKRQRAIVGKPIHPDCHDNMRPSKYARLLMEEAEQSVKELYDSMSQKYGDTGVYYDS